MPSFPAGARDTRPVLIDRCDECAFDGSRWTDQDVLTSLGVVGALWQLHLEGADDRVLHTRADPTTWSIAEYTWHLGDVCWGMRFLADSAIQSPGTDLGEVQAPEGITADPVAVDVAPALERLTTESRLLRDALAGVAPAQWPERVVLIDGGERDLGWIGRHALHDTMHHLHDVGRIRVRLGDGVDHQVGRVEHLAVSDGGVPKRTIDGFEVDWAGAVGDRQGDRKHHGRPFQALCLWSADVIEALQDEGHPIAAGSAGENVTVRGIDWAALRPGTILRIGDVRMELSSYATPCAKNAQWFADRGFARIDHDEHAGWSRLYATVRAPGSIAIGDEVEVEPPD